jgi:hypothetical protein
MPAYYTTENDVAHDVLAALDMYTGLMGSEGTVTLKLTLSNGDEYLLRVRGEA